MNEDAGTLSLRRTVPPPHGRRAVLMLGPPLEQARAAVILVHGRGGTADDILALREQWPAPGLAFAAPQADGDTWYPYSFLAPLARNEPHLSSGLALLGAIVGELDDRGIPPERQIVLGFSQGGCLTLEFAGRPVRVNDDPAGNGALQWFGTLSVAPDGRLEAVWNDTRGSANTNVSALYYSFSTDGGVTWSANEQASPTWNSTVGWPNQSKIGDYYHMLSDNTGADLAWAATFNGEEDVYYLRIPRQTVAAVVDPTRGVRLRPNLPNPFATSTTIHFDMPAEGGRVKLEVFDTGGRRVATLIDGIVGGGAQSARWTGTDAAGGAVKSGVYLCRLEAAGLSETRKLLLFR